MDASSLSLPFVQSALNMYVLDPFVFSYQVHGTMNFGEMNCSTWPVRVPDLGLAYRRLHRQNQKI